MWTLPSDISEAAKLKLEEHSSVLVSYVRELNELDALTLFKKGAKKYTGQRIFWQNPSKTVTLVGIGCTERYSSKAGNESYTELNQFKDKLKKQTVSNEIILGTGALLIGGFSFDSLAKADANWEEFQDAYFSLPTYLLTTTAEKSYITFNFYVTQADLIEKPLRIMKQWEELLATPFVTETEIAAITKKEELATDSWLAAVSETVDAIKASKELNKVVLSRQMLLTHETDVAIEAVLEKLRKTQQNSYFFVVENGEKTFLGATPERLLSAEGNKFYSACVAGSAKRGATFAEDQAIGDRLLADHKNVHEHQLVVEMIRHTMEGFTTDLAISGGPTLLKNRDIQHLFLTLAGTKEEHFSFLEAVKGMHPTPALGGVPTDLALEVIRQKEPYNRGFYGAPIGWVDSSDQGEFAVGIRSALIMGQKSLLFAGCGIVAGSDPTEELNETAIKFQPMLRALGGMENE